MTNAEQVAAALAEGDEEEATRLLMAGEYDRGVTDGWNAALAAVRELLGELAPYLLENDRMPDDRI